MGVAPTGISDRTGIRRIHMCSTISDRLKYLLPALMVLMLTACVALQPEGGHDTQDVSVLNGRTVQIYKYGYRETLRAGMMALGQMGVPAVDDLSDEVGTSIKAQLPDGTPVNVDIVDMGPGLAEVAVRAGRAGQWDRARAERLQASIGEALAIFRKPVPPAVEDSSGNSQAATAVAAATPPAGGKPQKAVAGKPVSAKGPAGPRPQFIIFFGANSDELSPEQMKALDKIARHILETPGARVKLNGYTDSLGDAGYNRMISEARASAVKFYLISRGVPPGNIKVTGYGPTNFIAENKTLAGRDRNRRVEIVISTPKHK